MDFKTEKLVRFYPEEKHHPQSTWSEDSVPLHLSKPSPSYHVPSPLLKPVRIGRIFGTPKIGQSKVFPEEHEPWQMQILDPGGDVVLQWNRVFLISCLVALFIDPLYFYLPSVGSMAGSSPSLCMKTDLNLRIIVTSFRTIADLFYLLHVVIKFRTAYVAPSTRVFGRGELVMDPKKIARRYLRTDFFIDFIATLPLPQIVVCSQMIKATGVVTKTAWAGAVYNLLLYMSWEHHGIFCRLNVRLHAGNLNAEAKQTLSYGQSLQTSTFIGETLFAILIAILGLVLFAHLIGNMQTYLQSITLRLEEWRLERRDTEEWMRHRQLPQDLREKVRRYLQYKWLATRGVDEESILRALPADLRRDIKQHLCLDLVRRVPLFSQMDDQLLDAICERLVSSLSTEGTYIVREGDPVTEMLFIIRGRLESSTTNGGRTGFFNSIILRPGDFCGEELLAWALLPKSALNLPSSTRTVRAFIEVEAFALRAEDLKFVANQFRRLHSKKLQHTFRFYSHHWRTWAACFIQAAWRRFKRRKMAKDLSLHESFYYASPEHVGSEEARKTEEDWDATPTTPSRTKQNLGITVLASRFAANTRKGVQKVKNVEMPKLQKPEEPDFSAEPDDDD
ncbi:hypothetical protein ACLOJK_002789 [Asimina triloba]